MSEYRYPCTGKITIKGFGEFLENETQESRRNIGLFAKELVERFGLPYISLVNSGSSANLVAALALAEKIKSKGLPLVAAISAFTFPTTVSSLLLAGFEVVVVDVEEGGFNISIEELRKLQQPISLIAVTHFLGFAADIKPIRSFADAHSAFILQDACESMELLSDEGRRCFEYGDITTWSFYHPHHLSSYGGGAVICNSQEDYLIVDSVVHWGRMCKCHFDSSLCTAPEGASHQFSYERIGVNVEISELNACFGRWQLQKWNDIELQRKENYSILFDALKDNNKLKIWPKPSQGGSLFVFPIELRDGRTIEDIYPTLKAQGLEIRTLMGGSLTLQKAFDNRVTVISDDNAQRMSSFCFFVGIHQTIPKEDAIEMGDIVNKYI